MASCSYTGNDFCHLGARHTSPHRTWHSDKIASLESQLAERDRELDERERILRMAYCRIASAPPGDLSLQSLREYQSGELLDILIAFEMALTEREVSQERSESKLSTAEAARDCLGNQVGSLQASIEDFEEQIVTLRARVEGLEKFTRFVSRNKGSHTAMAIELLERLKPTPEAQGCGKTFVDCFVYTVCESGGLLCPDCSKPTPDAGEE